MHSCIDIEPLPSNLHRTTGEPSTTAAPQPSSRTRPRRTKTPAGETVNTGVSVDVVVLHTIYRETLTHLESYEKRALEGKDLMVALDFTRWIQWSGILKLLKAYPAQGVCKVDGAFLEWKAREVQEMVQLQFRTKQIPRLPASTLDQINHKLDLIAGRLALMPNQ